MRTLLKLFSFALLLGVLSSFTADSSGYAVGDYVDTFSLKNVDGKHVSLNDYANKKGLIVVFTCNTCPYAKLYEERIMELDAKFEAKGFPVVAINPNSPEKQPGDSMDAMRSRAEEKAYSFPYLQDADGKVAQAFGATRTPHVYVLKKDKKGYQVAYIGAIDNNHKDAAAADKKYVEDAIEAISKGKQPAVTETKAIGCTIKWKEA